MKGILKMLGILALIAFALTPPGAILVVLPLTIYLITRDERERKERERAK